MPKKLLLISFSLIVVLVLVGAGCEKKTSDFIGDVGETDKQMTNTDSLDYDELQDEQVCEALKLVKSQYKQGNINVNCGNDIMSLYYRTNISLGGKLYYNHFVSINYKSDESYSGVNYDVECNEGEVIKIKGLGLCRTVNNEVSTGECTTCSTGPYSMATESIKFHLDPEKYSFYFEASKTNSQECSFNPDCCCVSEVDGVVELMASFLEALESQGVDLTQL